MRAFISVTILSLLSLQSIAADCDNMSTVRNKFHQARCTQSVKSFISYVKESDCPRAYPYLATAIMKQAEYVSSPIKKLQYFKKGRAMLEDYISKHPHDLEARYVRVLVQKNVPSILGYSSNIASDQKFIRTRITKCELSTSYKKTILKYIKS